VRNFWDLAWEDVAPETFVAYDVDGASYTGSARKSRAWYDRMRQLGRNVLGIMETTNERAQEGYNAGAYDVDFARRRWAERLIWPLALASWLFQLHRLGISRAS